MEKEYTRNCPKCGKEITYKKSYFLITAIKKNSLCRECGCGHCSLTIEEKQERKKEYRRRPEIKKRRREYQKERRKNPMIKLGGNISGAIRKSLKTKNLSKNKRHWEDIVGYSVQELKKHLEKLFLPGMDWSNRGEWHIDHRIPITFFKYNSTNDVEFKYCWSLNNLQPLWAEENISKTDRILKKYLKN